MPSCWLPQSTPRAYSFFFFIPPVQDHSGGGWQDPCVQTASERLQKRYADGRRPHRPSAAGQHWCVRLFRVHVSGTGARPECGVGRFLRPLEPLSLLRCCAQPPSLHLPAFDAGSGRLIGFTAATGSDIDGLGLLFLRPIKEATTDVEYTNKDNLRRPVADRLVPTKADNSQ